MNERWLEILLTPMRDQITVAETCRRYGIARQSFYAYQRRLYADGVAALAPQSRRPLTSPAQTMPEIEAEVVRLRKANPRWGARTIHTHLTRSGAPHVPAVSTIHRVLQRNSLVPPRPRRRKTGPRVLTVSSAGSVNYRKRKIGIGQHWKGQRVTVIETKPDHVVVLDRTTVAMTA